MTIGSLRRGAVVVGALAAVLGCGAAAYALGPWHEGRGARVETSARTERAVRVAVVGSPRPGATGVSTNDPVSIDVRGGHLRTLRVTAADGHALGGIKGSSWWMSDSRLAPATEYRVRAVVRAGNGRDVAKSWTFQTAVPTAALGGRVTPGDNEVVGVGMPITLRFDAPVVNKAAVEARLGVRTSVPVAGTWRWFGDREVHWRPIDYWPPHTEVWMTADLLGVDAGNGVFGNVNRTVHFRIGDSHVTVVDAAAHSMVVRENGNIVRVVPVSTGRDDKYPTMSGTHIVLGKAQSVVMDSRTNGIPLDSPDGYLETVFWDVQISSTGEYVHAAPWSVASQGRANVSHGCVNISTEAAQWFYGFSQKGDIVQVVGTSRPANDDPAMRDWKVPGVVWADGSALASPGYIAPKVRRF